MSWLDRVLGRRRSPRTRVLFAPDSYGGFLSAPEAADKVVARLRQHGVTVVAWPMSDGGEGLLDVLRAHGPLRSLPVEVQGPDGRLRSAEIGLRGDVAVIETAEATGLRWVGPDARRPLEASSAGVAALLRAAGDRSLRVGLGGSATVDGGLGMLRALGLRAEGADGQALDGPPARLLGQVRALRGDLPPLRGEAWADVRTPLSAAITTFGAQKGLPPDALRPHQAALDHFGTALATWAETQGRPLDPDLPGGGAAGGLGLALAALGLSLRPGAEAVADWTGLDLGTAQAVVVGEGRLDATSFEGKVAGLLRARARAADLPVVALVGTATDPGRAGVDHVVEAGAETLPAFVAACDQLAQWLLET